MIVKVHDVIKNMKGNIESFATANFYNNPACVKFFMSEKNRKQIDLQNGIAHIKLLN